MKKTLLIIGLAILVTSGCNQEFTNEVGETQEGNHAIESEQNADNKYEHADFTLVVPADFQKDTTRIKSEITGTFPSIKFFVVENDKNMTQEELLEWGVEKNKNLCTESEGCPSTISTENIELNGVKGIKHVTQSEGRGIDDNAGYLREYTFAFSKNNKHFRFWTSASDLENPERIEQEFSNIMQTIQLK